MPALGFERDDYPDDYRVNLYANHGFHALSLSEQRHDFRPLRFAGYQQPPEDKLQEVWFVGDHSDVGGGNIDSEHEPIGSVRNGLEKITREWMMEKFAAYKLFVPMKSEESCKSKTTPGCERGKLHDELLVSRHNTSLSNKIKGFIYQSAGLHWRTPQRQDTLHKSVLCRLKVEKLPNANKYREINNVYRPENLYSCIGQNYKVADDNYACIEGGELPEPYSVCN